MSEEDVRRALEIMYELAYSDGVNSADGVNELYSPTFAVEQVLKQIGLNSNEKA